jgi:hypothetical protein
VCYHALCGAHILLELRAAFENESQRGAKEMFDLLVEMNKAKNATPNGFLPRERIDFFRERYRTFLVSGEAELPPPEPRKEGARGRRKKSKAANLHKRLRKHEDEVLLFLEKPDVPFTNNLAERALHMVTPSTEDLGVRSHSRGSAAFRPHSKFRGHRPETGRRCFQVAEGGPPRSCLDSRPCRNRGS